jgi:hypothetical protein
MIAVAVLTLVVALELGIIILAWPEARRIAGELGDLFKFLLIFAAGAAALFLGSNLITKSKALLPSGGEVLEMVVGFVALFSGLWLWAIKAAEGWSSPLGPLSRKNAEVLGVLLFLGLPNSVWILGMVFDNTTKFLSVWEKIGWTSVAALLSIAAFGWLAYGFRRLAKHSGDKGLGIANHA